MNYYVVVEGRIVEKQVFSAWIPLINSTLTLVDHPSKLVSKNFCIVSGNGYPAYFDTVEAAFEDVRDCPYPCRLVICIDSEEMTSQEKYEEVKAFIGGLAIHVDYRIVVQHFCFETWALGNRAVGPRNPKNPTMVEFRGLYDVIKDDPEGLPGHVGRELNRSQFAASYLQHMLNDKNKGLTYSKSNPKFVAHPKYLSQLQRRLSDTGHIGSFQAFLDAFA